MRKKIIYSVLVTVLLIFSVIITASAADAYLGDVNGDGKVNASDARILLRHSAKLEDIKDEYLHLADINADEKVTSQDARIALRMSAKLESLFKYGEIYHSHEYSSSVVRPATCTAEGTERNVCNICGYEVDVSIPAKGHTFKDGNCTTPRRCTACGYDDGTAPGHKYADATCMAPKTCTVCGATSGSVLGHKTNGTAKCVRCGKDLAGLLKAAVDILDKEDLINGYRSKISNRSSNGVIITNSIYIHRTYAEIIELCKPYTELNSVKAYYTSAYNVIDREIKKAANSKGEIEVSYKNAVALMMAVVDAGEYEIDGLEALIIVRDYFK